MALDPQTIPFTPRGGSSSGAGPEEYWRFEADIMKVQQTQAEHAERLLRLEKRSNENARMKSVWGTSSPFPSLLGGTPQQRPVDQSPAEAFASFDDSSNLIGSLHLDAEEEPRRMGATSRANSVRFDETANQGHWSHPSRTSIDLIPRASSSMSSHPLLERTYSHKSDGRQSSAGQSVHSATSGRAGIDSLFNSVGPSPSELPGIMPGLSILGPVPSIIRCWLTVNFRHDSLLYAAICTGSYASHVDEDLLRRLGLARSIRTEADGTRKAKLVVYLPEATVHTPSSLRSISPAPQLPNLTIDFTVISSRVSSTTDLSASTASLSQSFAASAPIDKGIKVLIGCDVLQLRRADVHFASKLVTLFDDEQSKLSIPMVRPEDDHVFKGLMTMNVPSSLGSDDRDQMSSDGEILELKGLQQLLPKKAESPIPQPPMDTSSLVSMEDERMRQSPHTDSTTTAGRPSLEERFTQPILRNSGFAIMHTDAPKSSSEIDDGTIRASSRPAPSTISSTSGIWGNWRREKDEKPTAATASQPDWTAAKTVVSATPTPNMASYTRREGTGMKVLRPIKATSRAVSTSTQASAAPSPSSTGQSRFFDDGKRRTSLDDMGVQTPITATVPTGPLGMANATLLTGTLPPKTLRDMNGTGLASVSANPVVGGSKTKTSNPVGGASAFAWMNK